MVYKFPILEQLQVAHQRDIAVALCSVGLARMNCIASEMPSIDRYIEAYAECT